MKNWHWKSPRSSRQDRVGRSVEFGKARMKHYQWQRYWRPHGSALLFNEDGFLFSPGKFNSEVLSFEAIADAPCLVLLGEPGMGKSYAIKAARKAITAQAQQRGEDILWLDLRSYGSEDRLYTNLFKHQSFQNWLSGTHKLHLFLDSFDECQIAIPQLASLLADELENHQTRATRLGVRIACRTADWPSLLETALLQLFGSNSVKVYELAPLTREDVRIAAEEEHIDPTHFLNEVDSREAGPLASKPVTLRLLFGLYRNGSALPTSQTELYERGCFKLAEETSPNYIQTKRTGALNPAQRLALAARIAAVMTYSQKSAIWTAIDFAEHTGDDITTAELCGGMEFANELPFEIDEAAIEEVLNSGLFDSRGGNRMGWAHQTYAEFLAARYLAQLQMPTDQVLGLLAHPEDADGKLVPQLHETAAWLVGMKPDLFGEIMRREPQILLQSDVASADMATKVALVEELLKIYNEERAFENDWSRASSYHKLKHPNLADQLRPFIINPEKNFLVRRTAIKLAETCGVASLQCELAEVALDPAQIIDIRVYAARAIANIGTEETKLKLKPFIFGKADSDPEHYLQLQALRALWPVHISAEEVFSLFENPGLSEHFNSEELVAGLKTSDLPMALAWVRKQPGFQLMDYYERRLANKLVWLAWKNLDDAIVLRAFARTAFSRIKRGDELVVDRYTELDDIFSVSPQTKPKFSEAWKADEKKRHSILTAMVSQLGKDDFSLQGTFLYHLQQFFAEDVLWMIEQLLAETIEERQSVWAYLIKYSCNWQDQDQSLAILKACQALPSILGVFSSEIEILHRRLFEDNAKKATEKEESEEVEVKPLPSPSPTGQVIVLLNEFEAGNPVAWCKLIWTMRFREDGSEGEDEFSPDLKTYPVWKNAEAATKTRIIAAAHKYLLEQNAQTCEWLGINKLWPPAYAGYNALRLLYDEDQSALQSFERQIWKKWAPIIVAYVMFGDGKAEERAIQKALVEMAYRQAPDEIIATVQAEMDRDYAYVPTIIKGCWDERMGQALLNKARELYAKERSITDLLDELLIRNTVGATEFAKGLLREPFPADHEALQRIVSVADLLMKHSSDAAWEIIWPLIQIDPFFGQALIEKQAEMSRWQDKNPPIPTRLNESQLAALYAWMLHQYPLSEDIFIKGGHSPGSREMVGQWRGSILSNLRNRGTKAACLAIERLVAEFSDLKWLKAELLQAQALYRRQSWKPPEPAAIIKLAGELQQQLALKTEQQRKNKVFQCLWVLECAAEGSETLSDTCGQGTAFMLDGFGLVTCQHVLCPHIKAFRAEDPAKKYQVEVLAESATIDLATLRIIGVSDQAKLQSRVQQVLQDGERISVAGFPQYRSGDSGIFNSGEVIGFTTKFGEQRALVNVAIVSGNSGGPVLDSQGLVVGVAVLGTSQLSRAYQAEHGVIPIQALQRLVGG